MGRGQAGTVLSYILGKSPFWVRHCSAQTATFVCRTWVGVLAHRCRREPSLFSRISYCRRAGVSPRSLHSTVDDDRRCRVTVGHNISSSLSHRSPPPPTLTPLNGRKDCGGGGRRRRPRTGGRSSMALASTAGSNKPTCCNIGAVRPPVAPPHDEFRRIVPPPPLP